MKLIFLLLFCCIVFKGVAQDQNSNQNDMNFFQKLFKKSVKDDSTLAKILGPLKKNKDYAGFYESEPIAIPYFNEVKNKSDGDERR